MSDTNLAPEATGNDEALTVDAGADAITDLLKDPETDLSEEDQGQEEATEEAEGEPEAETEEASEEEPAEKEEDGPQEDAGRFVADSGKVRLKDGSVISVQDLKRGYLSQASFTRGTQENAKERETLASQKAEVEQYARTLQQQRDFLLQVSQQFVPQPPDRSLLDQNSVNYDPIRYAALKADYDDRIGALQHLQGMTQAEQARMSQEQQKQQQELRAREAQRLFEAMPDLKKPDVQKKFWADAVETMGEYGFSEEELQNTIDHRVYRIFRDLTAYRKARSQAPSVAKTMQTKPVLTGKKRMDPKAKTSRETQVRHEQLRKTGDFDAGVRSLMDLDL